MQAMQLLAWHLIQTINRTCQSRGRAEYLRREVRAGLLPASGLKNSALVVREWPCWGAWPLKRWDMGVGGSDSEMPDGAVSRAAISCNIELCSVLRQAALQVVVTRCLRASGLQSAAMSTGPSGHEESDVDM